MWPINDKNIEKFLGNNVDVDVNVNTFLLNSAATTA